MVGLVLGGALPGMAVRAEVRAFMTERVHLLLNWATSVWRGMVL